MNTKFSMVACLAIAASSSPAWGQTVDANLGRNMAAKCANCHGTNGASVGGMAALAGQSSEALIKVLTEFLEGKRPATIMHQLSKGYSDAQIALIANYFAAQKTK